MEPARNGNTNYSTNSLKESDRHSVCYFSESSDMIKQPIVNVILHKIIDAEKKLPYTALIDTGATQSVLSQRIITELGLNVLSTGTRNDLHSEGTPVDIYVVGIEVTGTDNSKYQTQLVVNNAHRDLIIADILLGLDVLQHGNFVYDGLNKRYTLVFPQAPESNTDTAVSSKEVKKDVVINTINTVK
jgi:predicted aspartyl protease